MRYLQRKIDSFLEDWYSNPNKSPLIIKGARQIGKTESILHFANKHYKSIININFVINEEFLSIFDDGYSVEAITKNISLMHPEYEFVPNTTLIFFDEIQKCPKCATSLKAFKIDNRYDVICSGSLLGVSYGEIESVSVGYKQDYKMYSLDFEEFLWALGYKDNVIDDMLSHMIELKPFSSIEMDVFIKRFHEYMVLGGMPKVISLFVENNNYSGTLSIQKQILLDYEEDITKYAYGLDKAKILNVYRKIPVFLGKDNKKFQISKVSEGARTREYTGTTDWLYDAGIINICYCMSNLSLPLKGNYNPNSYKIYYMDTGLLTASLDEEASQGLRERKNFNTYKGALYENIVADMLVKEGYELYYYRDERGLIVLDFLVRDSDSLIPLEIKAKDNDPKAMKAVINNNYLTDIKYGIKFAEKNIGYNDVFYTFPYFLVFLLKRYLAIKSNHQEQQFKI